MHKNYNRIVTLAALMTLALSGVAAFSHGAPAGSVSGDFSGSNSGSAPETVASAPDCKVCFKEKQFLIQQAEVKEKTVDLLGKNNAYLALVGSHEGSKFLKLKSNTVMILKRLETIREETQKAEAAYEKRGCFKCEKEESKA